MATLSTLQPKEILSYKRFDSETSLSDIEIPESAENRRKTDKHFLIVFGVFTLLLMPFLIYTLSYSDINRLLHGYDSCGNVCGERNVKYDEWDCTGKDMTDRPLHRNSKCVAIGLQNLFDNSITRDEYGDSRFRDLPSGTDNEVDLSFEAAHIYFQRVGWKITLASFLSIGYCLVMVFLFRHATAVLVWGILILSWTCLLLLNVILWTKVVESADNRSVGANVVFSITVLVLLCIMIFMHKRIRLVIMLIKESSKAVFDMPPIFLAPAMAILILILITASCAVSTTYIVSSGILTEVSNKSFEYIPNAWMIATLVINIIMAYWAITFITGIQYMMVSGAISKWYFTKNKSLLGNPIITSAFITFKFHLGTIALGSLIITLVAILRGFMRGLARNPRLKLLVDCCMSYIERFLKFFTRNAYIITAMHGTPFFESGKQAVRLIALNICNTIAVNYIGDFVLGMAHVLLFCFSIATTYVIFLGEEYHPYMMFCYLIVALVTLLCSVTILSTFQTSMDTMFLCFCEDCLINDGINKPYSMPRGFMEFVDSSKKAFAVQIQEKGLPTI